MPITTATKVRSALRIDDARLDAEIDSLIAAVQSTIEHECGLAAGAMDTATDAGAERAAILLVCLLLDNPTAGRDEQEPILKSALLDKARTWL